MGMELVEGDGLMACAKLAHCSKEKRFIYGCFCCVHGRVC